MSANLAAIAYLIASICFIMALRGLSSPDSARMGNIVGVIGMVIAVATTLAAPGVVSYGLIIVGVLIGGSIGTVIALRIQMTALPQLVAAFHSLVGLAAVCVAAAAFYHPEAYGIMGEGGIHLSTLIEMSLGTAIGAVTFTGSIIAFAKLQAILSGKPLVFPGQHFLNAAQGVALVLLIVWFAASGAPLAFWLIVILSLTLGIHLVMAIGGATCRSWSRCSTATRAGRRCGRLHALERPADRHGRAGRLLRRHPELHHVQGDEPLDLQRHPRRLRRRDRRRRQVPAPPTARSSRARPTTRPSSSRTPVLSSSCRATAWRWRRRSMRCTRCRPAREGRDQGALRHPPGGGPPARAHERAARRGQRALRHRARDGGDQRRLPHDRRRHGDRRQRHRQPGAPGRSDEPDLRHAGARGLEGARPWS